MIALALVPRRSPSLRFCSNPLGCGSKIGTQNGTLVNANTTPTWCHVQSPKSRGPRAAHRPWQPLLDFAQVAALQTEAPVGWMDRVLGVFEET